MVQVCSYILSQEGFNLLVLFLCTLCADLPSAKPLLLAEAQQAGQSSIRAPAAASAGAAATGKAPKRAKRAKAPEAAATSLAPKCFDAPSEAAGSQQETATGRAEKPVEAVEAMPAVASAASAAATADKLPYSNGGSAASKGATSAGAAGSKAKPSAAADTVVAGSKTKLAAAADTIPIDATAELAAAADTGAPAGQPPAAPAASSSLLSAQAASKAAQTSAADQHVLQQGTPGPAPAVAASCQLEQPAGAAGKQIVSPAGPVPHGPGEPDRPAGAAPHGPGEPDRPTGAALLSSNLPAATAPAEANVSKAAQQEGSKLASTSQEVGEITPASPPGKAHQPTIPAKTGVVSASADSVYQQVQDVTRPDTNFDPESSPTLVADVKVIRNC